jgi:hypothetical protein
LIGSQSLAASHPPVSKRERESVKAAKAGQKKALWKNDRCDLTEAPFCF